MPVRGISFNMHSRIRTVIRSGNGILLEITPIIPDRIRENGISPVEITGRSFRMCRVMEKFPLLHRNTHVCRIRRLSESEMCLPTGILPNRTIGVRMTIRTEVPLSRSSETISRSNEVFFRR